MFKHFFKKSNDDDIFETVDPIVEQRRNEKFSKPLIYDEEFKKEEVTKKSEGQQIPKETTSKNVKKVEKKVAKKEEPEVKKNYEMMDIISPMFGMHEEKKETVRIVKKNSVKKPKKKDNSLVQVISPYYGNFEEKEVKEAFWHTSAHVLAQAVKRLYPDTKCAIGPAIDNGFYYDFDFSFPFTEENLAAIEKEMKKIVKQSLPLEVFEVTKEKALDYMKERQGKGWLEES